MLDCKDGKKECLYLGNLNAKRDWSYAKDVVEAMWLMLQQPYPDDFVIGSGKSYSIIDFLKVVSEYIKINWEDFVKIDANLYRPTEVNYLLANPKKAEDILGWKSKTSLEELVKIMVNAEIERRGK